MDVSPDAFTTPGAFRRADGFGHLPQANATQAGGGIGFAKLTFHVIRRMIAISGKSKGHHKNIQGLMRHSRLAMTIEVYMQSLQKEVRTAINSIHDELMATGTAGSEPQPPTVLEARTNHGVKTSGRGLMMERQRKQKGEDGENKMPSRRKIIPFAGKMRANDFEAFR